MEIKYMFPEGWMKTNKVVLYGFGGLTRDNFSLIKKYYEISYIVDSNKEKCGGQFEGVAVRWINDVSEEISDCKIIIMSTGYMVDEITEKLCGYGLLAYEDFCTFEQWMMETEWRRERKVCLLEVNTFITNKCTLKCKHCNMYMPYYEHPNDYSVQDFMLDIDLLFNYVDYSCQLTLLGGEPLLNKHLKGMLSWVSKKYNDKIGKPH